MNEGALPWGTLFGLLFMTMGPIRAVAVFGGYGESDTASGVRALAGRAAGLVGIAFDATAVRASRLAFPALFPPVAVAVAIPIIFAAAAPGAGNKAAILGLGLALLVLNWVAMRHAKAIQRAIGPTPLQLFGAVFGVLQVALGIEFLLDASRML